MSMLKIFLLILLKNNNFAIKNNTFYMNINNKNSSNNDKRELIVPMFCHEEYFDEIKETGYEHKIFEFYGSLSWSPLGSGRSAGSIGKIEKDDICSFIQKAHSKNIRFSYALNALCLGNIEYTSEGRKLIFEFLDWLSSIGTDAVVVSNPFIANIISKHYQHLEIQVSTFAFINSIPRAKFWINEFGAKEIKIHQSISRNFELIKSLGQLNVPLTVLVNQMCLYDCPLTPYHCVYVSHDSQKEPGKEYFLPDWCRVECNRIRWKNTEEIVKARWIRPEDMQVYRDSGVRHFKLVGRNQNQIKKTINRLIAYGSGKWDDNLLKIIGEAPPPFELTNFYPIEKFKNLFTSPLYYFDNTKLKGFIDFFIENGDKCSERCEIECNYCNEIARKFITTESVERVNEFIQALIKLEDNINKKNVSIVNYISPFKI